MEQISPSLNTIPESTVSTNTPGAALDNGFPNTKEKSSKKPVTQSDANKAGSKTNEEKNGQLSRYASGNKTVKTVSTNEEGTTENDGKINGEEEEKEGKQEEQQETTTATNAHTSWSTGPGIFVIIGAAAVLAAAILVIIVAKLNRKRNRYMYMDNQGRTMSPGNNNDQGAVKMINTTKHAPVRIARVHGVGRRPMQQDSFGLSDVEDQSTLDNKGVLAIVADGMGGLEDGEKMSQMVVVTMLQGFDESTGDEVPSSLLLNLVDNANSAVNDALGDDRLGLCGSTVVSVIVKNQKLYYLSVGDSHIYVYRNGSITQINKDHNYAAELDEMARNGEISLDEAALDPKRNALTSFIGIGDLELIDYNEKPIALEPHDRILLMSDGVYGTVYEEGLCKAMKAPLKKACYMIDEMISAAGKPKQDNYTCVVLEIRDNG